MNMNSLFDSLCRITETEYGANGGVTRAYFSFNARISDELLKICLFRTYFAYFKGYNAFQERFEISEKFPIENWVDAYTLAIANADAIWQFCRTKDVFKNQEEIARLVKVCLDEAKKFIAEGLTWKWPVVDLGPLRPLDSNDYNAFARRIGAMQ